MPSCWCKVTSLPYFTNPFSLSSPDQPLTTHLFFRSTAKQVVTFTQKLADVSAKEKDTMATFECETNEPFVKVRWLKNNMEIFTGDKYRMHSDRKVHFLSVLMISMKDEAEYSCVVIDDDIRTTAKLSVEGQWANQ